jgi:hypothetical protein
MGVIIFCCRILLGYSGLGGALNEAQAEPAESPILICISSHSTTGKYKRLLPVQNCRHSEGQNLPFFALISQRAPVALNKLNPLHAMLYVHLLSL